MNEARHEEKLRMEDAPLCFGFTGRLEVLLDRAGWIGSDRKTLSCGLVEKVWFPDVGQNHAEEVGHGHKSSN